MSKRTLVTTGLIETWPNDKPISFLGEWCLSYGKQELFNDLDYELVAYHWSDRSKLKRDFDLLDEYYEYELANLAKILNQRHGTNYSVRYWRILIGPWLGYFTHILYDRWSMLRLALENGSVDSVKIIDREVGDLIPEDMHEFLGLIGGNDWNEMIYAELISSLYGSKIKIEKVKIRQLCDAQGHGTMGCYRREITVFFNKTISALLRCIVNDREYFFKSTVFSLKTLIAIQLRLGYLPKFWRTKKFKYISRCHISRPKINTQDDFNFKSILHAMVQRHIPVSYLEGNSDLIENVQGLPWPSSPKAIFTHVAWEADDLFKAWVAEKTNLGCPLVIGQHGGHYGVGLFSFVANHEIAIADKYLTWGWNDTSVSHISNSFASKSWPAGLKHDPLGELIILFGGYTLYSNYLWAAPISSQWASYFEDQANFIRHLSSEIKAVTRVRLPSKDYGWDAARRVSDFAPEVKIDFGHEEISKVIPKCRLVISTYNATTYLESMSRDIPTIIFWDPEVWELKDEVIPFFELLCSVGIFHKSPQSAASKVLEIWADVDNWWDSTPVQVAREKFCREFVVLSKNIEVDMVAEIAEVVPRC
ncbi:LIC12162 family protein [Pseudomonadales bacterium]|nr:LIC12162 family protein [Pseudomonadales bacterium]